MLESVLYKYLRKSLPDFFLQRIESLTGLGVPDLWMSHVSGINMWAELKAISTPANYFTVPFRKGQYAWARRAMKNGTNVCLIIAIDSGVYLFFNDAIKEKYEMHSLRKTSNINCSDITNKVYQRAFRNKFIEKYGYKPY